MYKIIAHHKNQMFVLNNACWNRQMRSTLYPKYQQQEPKRVDRTGIYVCITFWFLTTLLASKKMTFLCFSSYKMSLSDAFRFRLCQRVDGREPFSELFATDLSLKKVKPFTWLQSSIFFSFSCLSSYLLVSKPFNRDINWNRIWLYKI